MSAELAPGEVPPPTPRVIPTGIAWELPEPGPEADATDQLEDAQRFGATFSPGGFVATPVVSIDGVDVASGPTAGQISGQLVVDGLSVRWGREKVLEQPEPSTAQLTLFDADGTWALRRQLIGALVLIDYTGVVSGVGAGTGPKRKTFFRGRVQRVRLSRKTVRQADGTKVHGTLVSMPLVSTVAELGNIKPTEAWPVETVNFRAGRIYAAASPVIAGVNTRPFWDTPQVNSVADTEQKTLLEHATALYDSTGADRMTHWPEQNTLNYVVRRDYTTRGLVGLWWDQTTDERSPGRAGKGAYARTLALAPVGGITGAPDYIDGAGVEDPGEGSLSQGPEQRISRVRMTNPNGSVAAPYPDRSTVTLIPDVDESVAGVRQASVDSLLTWNGWADLAASDIATMAQKEARAWQLPPLVWDTRRTGGFETYQQAFNHLFGGEQPSLFMLQRSWLPSMGVRPVFGVMGATISYQRGHWRLELNAAPVVTSDRQHSITWEEIDDGSATYQVQLWDSPNPRGMHESLSIDDLEYVSSGVGVVTIPPDTGWDKEIR